MVVVGHNASTRRTLARDLALYSVARLALVTVVALLLMLVGVPLLVSALLAMVLALPLSMLLLGRLRGRVNTGLAVVAERRKAERDRLRQQLQGETHR
jgi:O-antigen/teichoic acid export membrane protein